MRDSVRDRGADQGRDGGTGCPQFFFGVVQQRTGSFLAPPKLRVTMRVHARVRSFHESSRRCSSQMIIGGIRSLRGQGWGLPVGVEIIAEACGSTKQSEEPMRGWRGG
ncbi:uncharacterized protein CCOS01_07104 [Colletotrichum costaricense]|uniref:Uncharacterized protein n=1 Tax=Colletotrichum costaricense TaxID=1209916 RepID=A0AAI9YZU3_9PEZI|nr:uncharacterized protein CCOS01_07104 [Colletotrichum costaricense]KAK1529270.1 hypothetical protein CCOS01_07104 [Colletotrichum costaricense]